MGMEIPFGMMTLTPTPGNPTITQQMLGLIYMLKKGDLTLSGRTAVMKGQEIVAQQVSIGFSDKKLL